MMRSQGTLSQARECALPRPVRKDVYHLIECPEVLVEEEDKERVQGNEPCKSGRSIFLASQSWPRQRSTRGGSSTG